MIQSLNIKNHVNQEVNIVLTDSEPSHGLIIKEITGIGSPKANVNITDTSSDGGYFNNVRAEKRTIQITFLLMMMPDVETSRHNLYRYLPLHGKITLKFITDKRSVYAEGYVESIDPNIFSEQEECVVSIVCPDPYFKDVVKVINQDIWDLYCETPNFEFPVDNSSEEYLGEARKFLSEEYWGTPEHPNMYPYTDMTDDDVYKWFKDNADTLSMGGQVYSAHGLEIALKLNQIEFIRNVRYGGNKSWLSIQNSLLVPNVNYKGDFNNGIIMNFFIKEGRGSGTFYNYLIEKYHLRRENGSQGDPFIKIRNYTTGSSTYINLYKLGLALDYGAYNPQANLYDKNNYMIELSTIKNNKYLTIHGWGPGYESPEYDADWAFFRTDNYSLNLNKLEWIELLPNKNVIGVSLINGVYYAQYSEEHWEETVINRPDIVNPDYNTYYDCGLFKLFDSITMSYDTLYEGV